MIKALVASRRRYSEWFGQFPWKELKLSEFPGLADYAQGFPTNITFSESIGFKTLSDEDSNAAFYVTAHEAAHQWFGNMMVPGEGPGGNVLSESLANYAAMRLIEKELGERSRIGLMRQMEFRYVQSRRSDDERPLVKIDGRKPTDQVSTYERGGWVFWMMSELMGQQAFHEGLSEMIRKFPAGSEDAPLVEDLLEVLRSHGIDKNRFDRFVEEWVKGTVLPRHDRL
jgi:aminopeptidase N